MQTTELPARAKEDIKFTDIKYKSDDCRDILESCTLNYLQENEYLQVGDIPMEGNWELQISVIMLEFTSLLKRIVPVLVSEKVPFRIPKDKTTARKIIDGDFGVMKLGKLIGVYPSPGKQLTELAKILVTLTKEFRGPAIPNYRSLGNCVFTQDDRFIPIKTKWPFDELTPYKLPNKKPLWNYKYKPLFVIKLDLKGRVIQGNYFKSLFNIKLCIIKEGIKNMWSDDFGRDIVDRLNWQYQLYTDLAGYVPTPKIFDMFEENGNTYLAMEFIKGNSVNDKVGIINKGNSWSELSGEEKMLLTGYLQDVVVLVEKLHKKGYIHRDITPANFIVDKKGNILLIDMELAYSTVLHKPDPPFKLGTDGYISPEQMNGQKPTIKEDIYALGAFMIFIFTGLPPIKFNMRKEEELSRSLSLFIESPTLIDLIQNCLSAKPETRPTLSKVAEELGNYQVQLKESPTSKINKHYPENPLDQQQFNRVIQQALETLSLPQIVSPEGLWTFRKEEDATFDIQSGERIPLTGFATGIAGIILLLSRAHRLGYNIDACIQPYTRNFKYIKEYYLDDPSAIDRGIFTGSAGLAMAWNEAIESSLLTEQDHGLLQSCFSPAPYGGIDLATGIAGQGMALLRCHNNLEPKFFYSHLEEITNELLISQQNDGSWNNFRKNNRKDDNAIGLANGAAGIICFLLACLYHYKNEQILASIQKGLRWLLKKAEKKNGRYIWPISTKSKSSDDTSCTIGIPGIALTFIKAYQLLQDPIYKTVAENALYRLPKQPITRDFTQMNGLSGLGEVYLEAYYTFKSDNWLERSNWIASLFTHTLLPSGKTSGYWSMDATPDYEGSLMIGCSGIIHFLMRTRMTNTIIDHPLINNES